MCAVWQPHRFGKNSRQQIYFYGFHLVNGLGKFLVVITELSKHSNETGQFKKCYNFKILYNSIPEFLRIQLHECVYTTAALMRPIIDCKTFAKN